MRKPTRPKPRRRPPQPVARAQGGQRREPAQSQVASLARLIAADVDRSALTLLMLPVFLIAFSLAASQTARRSASYPALFNQFAFDQPGPASAPVVARAPPPAAPIEYFPGSAVRSGSAGEGSAARLTAPGRSAAISPLPLQRFQELPNSTIIGQGPRLDVASRRDRSSLVLSLPRPMPPPSAVFELPARTFVEPDPPQAEATVTPGREMAIIAAAPAQSFPPKTEVARTAPPDGSLEIATEPDRTSKGEPAVCVAEAADPTGLGSRMANNSAGSVDFGLRLAAAALAQTRDLVVYTARYKRIGFPMGDLPALHGACVDVVVRAYRALGVDLQELVQKARLGQGDANIDHRRTETLRVLFSRYGESLAVSPFPEDYLPGDIVTYYRPFSRVSRAHIAIVADVLGPTGRPMIVHNRGWGPQLEDALFADRITGHYRYTGVSPTVAASHGRTPQIRSRVLLQRAALVATASGASGRRGAAAVQGDAPSLPGL